ncbi:MAG: copper resistance protein B [Chloroflexota bacterium]|nr:copper resistance protein B [Chloroflexota bacterium]
MRILALLACAATVLVALAPATRAQTTTSRDEVRLFSGMNGSGMQPVMDNGIVTHGLLEQLEGRWNGRNQEFRYDGQLWSGTDLNKLWLKSEGLVNNQGRFTDGQHELLYDRAISSYFDLQAGVRVDLDSAVTRTWAAFGVQGLSLYFFDVEATGYVSEQGRFAGRLKASYDLFITQRLILQPEAEINLYSKSDIARGVGSGLSDIDTGLRLRYEITRKFAPYVGVAYAGRFFQSAAFARREGETPNDLRFVFGVRTWF